jgi:hypothetical protein
MLDADETNTTETSEKSGRPAGSAGGGRPSAAKGGSSSSKLLLIAGAILAVVVVALGAVLWSRSSGGSSYSAQETTDAKTSLCKSSLLATRSVVRNTHLKNPAPDNPVGQLAVAANARLALAGGGSYLHDQLDAHPAAPQDLSDSVEKLATTFESLGMSYMAGEGNDARESLRKDLDTQIKEIDGLCK